MLVLLKSKYEKNVSFLKYTERNNFICDCKVTVDLKARKLCVTCAAREQTERAQLDEAVFIAPNFNCCRRFDKMPFKCRQVDRNAKNV